MSESSNYRFKVLTLLVVGLAVLAGCGGGGDGDTETTSSGGSDETTAESTSAVDPSCDVEGAQTAVLPHFKSPFTQQFIEGGEAAAAECNATLKSAGPSEIDTPVQIREFGDLVTTGAKAIVTVAYPSNLWVKPIDEAVEKGVEVGTVDVASPASKQLIMAAPKQTDFGRSLGAAMVEQLGEGASGEIVTGICFPGLDVLEQRLVGFREVVEGELPEVEIADPIDTTFEPASNFSAWQRLMQDHPDALAVVGVCDGDAANQLKVRQESTDAQWIIGGVNYDPVSLEGLENEEIAVLVGAQPFMQGYTAMRALLTKIAGGDVPRGWIDTGTETTTPENVAEVIAREEAAESGWEVPREAYGDQIEAIFGELAGQVQPFGEYVKP